MSKRSASSGKSTGRSSRASAAPATAPDADTSISAASAVIGTAGSGADAASSRAAADTGRGTGCAAHTQDSHDKEPFEPGLFAGLEGDFGRDEPEEEQPSQSRSGKGQRSQSDRGAKGKRATRGKSRSGSGSSKDQSITDAEADDSGSVAVDAAAGESASGSGKGASGRKASDAGSKGGKKSSRAGSGKGKKKDKDQLPQSDLYDSLPESMKRMAQGIKPEEPPPPPEEDIKRWVAQATRAEAPDPFEAVMGSDPISLASNPIGIGSFFQDDEENDASYVVDENSRLRYRPTEKQKRLLESMPPVLDAEDLRERRHDRSFKSSAELDPSVDLTELELLRKRRLWERFYRRLEEKLRDEDEQRRQGTHAELQVERMNSTSSDYFGPNLLATEGRGSQSFFAESDIRAVNDSNYVDESNSRIHIPNTMDPPRPLFITTHLERPAKPNLRSLLESTYDDLAPLKQPAAPPASAAAAADAAATAREAAAAAAASRVPAAQAEATDAAAGLTAKSATDGVVPEGVVRMHPAARRAASSPAGVRRSELDEMVRRGTAAVQADSPAGCSHSAAGNSHSAAGGAAGGGNVREVRMGNEAAARSHSGVEAQGKHAACESLMKAVSQSRRHYSLHVSGRRTGSPAAGLMTMQQQICFVVDLTGMPCMPLNRDEADFLIAAGEADAVEDDVIRLRMRRDDALPNESYVHDLTSAALDIPPPGSIRLLVELGDCALLRVVNGQELIHQEKWLLPPLLDDICHGRLTEVDEDSEDSSRPDRSDASSADTEKTGPQESCCNETSCQELATEELSGPCAGNMSALAGAPGTFFGIDWEHSGVQDYLQLRAQSVKAEVAASDDAEDKAYASGTEACGMAGRVAGFAALDGMSMSFGDGSEPELEESLADAVNSQVRTARPRCMMRLADGREIDLNSPEFERQLNNLLGDYCRALAGRVTRLRSLMPVSTVETAALSYNYDRIFTS